MSINEMNIRTAYTTCHNCIIMLYDENVHLFHLTNKIKYVDENKKRLFKKAEYSNLTIAEINLLL